MDDGRDRGQHGRGWDADLGVVPVVGAGRKADDALRKVAPRLEGEVDLVRRQRRALVQREDGVRFDHVPRPASRHTHKCSTRY